jgi:hypothetical protein
MPVMDPLHLTLFVATTYKHRARPRSASKALLSADVDSPLIERTRFRDKFLSHEIEECARG